MEALTEAILSSEAAWAGVQNPEEVAVIGETNNMVLPCSLGGHVVLRFDPFDVSVETSGDTMRIAMQTEQELASCRVPGNQRLFTLSGRLNAGSSVTLLLFPDDPVLLEGHSTITGSVDWAFNGREGSCEVNMERNASESFATLSGTLCGRAIERRAPL